MSATVNFSGLRLVMPCMEYIDSFRAACEEYKSHDIADFAYPKVATKRQAARYFAQLGDYSRGISLPEGRVPHSSFWLVDGVNYLGTGDIRHFLTDNLRRLGGNIGYSIRPRYWRQGLGTIQLALLLHEARRLHIFTPLITCFDGNLASAKIIERNGGVLLRKITNGTGAAARLTRIYEIDLR